MPGSLRLRDNNTLRADTDPRVDLRGRDGERASIDRNGRPASGAPMVVLGLKGLVLLWSAWGATLLVAFLLGSSLGRHQGVETALEEYSREAVPQPVPGYARKAPEIPSPNAASEKSTEAQQSPLLTESLVASRAPAITMTQSPESMLPEKVSGSGATVQGAGEPAAEPVSSWTVQAATFRSRTEAEKISKKFQRLKIPVSISQTPKGGATYFRVVLGPYPTLERANQAKTQAVRTKIVRGELYVKQAAVTPSPGKLLSDAERNQQ